MGRVTAFRPFGSADLHLSPNTVLEYRYATSQPDSRMEKGFDSAPADLSESGPHVSLAGFTSTLERAHHHEVSLSHRMGKTNLQIAMYSDRVADPALTGVGDASSDSGEVLPDLVLRDLYLPGKEAGRAWHAGGVAAQADVGPHGDPGLRIRRSARSEAQDRAISRCRTLAPTAMVRNRHTAAAKFSGTLPGTKTRWITSYRWISGQALTPVDMFNASAGQSDPFLNILSAPTHSRNRLPAGPHGRCHRCAQSSGPGLCSVAGTGWPHGLSGAVSALHSRRRGVSVSSSGHPVRSSPFQHSTFSIQRKSPVA